MIAATASTASAQSAPGRDGFTFLANLGVGVQNDTGIEENGIGLGGANLGLGAFVTPEVAILGRFSGTNVSYETSFGNFRQVSGVFAPTVQFWPNEKVNLQAGAGFGVWSADGESDRGLGLILGAGFTVFNRGKHNLQVGFEYAPAFTEPGTVHNFGITFGYQLF